MAPGMSRGFRCVAGVFQRFKACFKGIQGAVGVSGGSPKVFQSVSGSFREVQVFSGISCWGCYAVSSAP